MLKDLFKKATAVAFFVFGASCFAQGRYLVVAANPLAAEAGAAILKQGGTAADAAVAVQAMLGLVEPQSSGIGGGAFLLYWSEKEKILRAYDGRETAPGAAKPDRFLKQDLMEAIVSGRSVGVPGTLRMLELAHGRHGRLPWAELFAQAIFSAEEGFAISPRLHSWLSRERYLRAELYYENGKPRAVGSKLVNREYGRTLREIAQRGPDAFYRGRIAGEIVRAVTSHAREAFADLLATRRRSLLTRAQAMRRTGPLPASQPGNPARQFSGASHPNYSGKTLSCVLARKFFLPGADECSRFRPFSPRGYSSRFSS